jgi:hypothetical protein
MFFNKNSLSLRRALLALALSACAGLAAADATYHVELDTTGFGDNGWIDLQFNPGSAGNSAAATVGLSGFTGFDASVAADVTDSVSGSLAGGYSIANTYDSNYLFHAVTFGGKVGFDVTFSGAGDPSPQAWGSMFSVALMNADYTAYLGNYGTDGSSLLQLSWTPAATLGGQGVVGSEVFDTAAVSVSAVPEPSTWLMLGAGLGLIGWSRRRAA